MFLVGTEAFFSKRSFDNFEDFFSGGHLEKKSNEGNTQRCMYMMDEYRGKNEESLKRLVVCM